MNSSSSPIEFVRTASISRNNISPIKIPNKTGSRCCCSCVGNCCVFGYADCVIYGEISGGCFKDLNSHYIRIKTTNFFVSHRNIMNSNSCNSRIKSPYRRINNSISQPHCRTISIATCDCQIKIKRSRIRSQTNRVNMFYFHSYHRTIICIASRHHGCISARIIAHRHHFNNHFFASR